MRIGILGAGEMGRTHAAAYAAMPEVQIAGVVSRSEGRAASLGGELGVPALTDPSILLEDDSVDAIDVTYPSGLHRQQVVAALERGKHVFCETPIALTLEDADAMVEAARRHKRVLIVAQLMRLVPDWVFIRDEISSGKLGRPIAAYVSRRSPPYGAGQERDLSLYGEPVVELMIFDFDFLTWLLGMPASVAGTGVTGPSGAIDYAFVSLDFGEAQGLVEGSAMMPRSFPFTTSLRVLCEDGALECSGSFTGGPIPETSLMRYPKEGERESLQIPEWDPYEAECRHFVQCVLGAADPAPLDAESARDGLRVALAARESLITGEVVRLLPAVT